MTVRQLMISCCAVVTAMCFLILLGRQELQPLPEGITANRIVIRKADHRLALYQGDKMLREYPVSLGRGGMEAKRQEGDRRTPEGQYRITSRNARSGYHRALRLNYPNAADIKAARKLGASAGSDIMIHGTRTGFGWLGTLHRLVDWTQGCVALTNEEIEEVWRVVPDGTLVVIQS